MNFYLTSFSGGFFIMQAVVNLDRVLQIESN
jgi:hypothetical protein